MVSLAYVNKMRNGSTQISSVMFRGCRAKVSFQLDPPELDSQC